LTFHADDAATARYFPDKLPIDLDRERDKYIFLYLLTRDLPVDFRMFLERHAELLRALPGWTVRLLVPRHKTDAIPLYQAAFREQVATPLEPSVLDDVRWYFHARRRATRDSDERFDQAARAFGAPRFQALYRAWLERGEPVLDATLSPVLADAVTWGMGQLECYVLPHSYVRLLPLVGTA
jgi:hypothetical protein